MDVSSLSAVSNVNVQSAVSVKVAQKAMDVAEQQGQAAVEMIKSAGQAQGGVDANGHVDVMA